jgi:hypothetical protein
MPRASCAWWPLLVVLVPVVAGTGVALARERRGSGLANYYVD